MINTPSNIKDYHRQLRAALGDEFLSAALDSFFRSYRENRPNVFAGLDFAALSAEIGQIKDSGLPHIMELFAQFKERAQAKGVQVHFAADAADANKIIADIGRKAGARKVVKAKSMTAEETFLNDHLEASGFQVTETDLGEWIIQLRHEGPSHMVMPAIHLSRGQVAELFTKVTGQEQDPDDINGMVKVARKWLRQAYLEADMGISGANFAIAETGTLGLVTNEGNARLTTTLPRVHVALVGLDKLLPDLESALKILRILPKNATGQVISTYVTWITGANECAAAPDGTKQMHIVFLDNGRLALAADPVLSQALRCVRCGACANVCPVYRQVGGHNYGHVYIGAIGLILTMLYHGKGNARAIVKACLNCGACKEVCAGGIDLPHLVKKSLGRVYRADDGPPVKNRLLALAMRDRRVFHAMLRSTRLAQQPLADGDGKMIRHLPMIFGEDQKFRSLPVITDKPLRDRWERIAPRVDQPKVKAALFAGCLTDFVYPEQAESLAELLKGREVSLDMPLGQSCCGLPLAMMADEAMAAKVARANIEAFASGGYEHIVTLCASCASHLKHGYPKLARLISLNQAAIDGFCSKIMDASSFLADVLDWQPEDRPNRAKLAYHAPCHLCRGLGVHEAPKELMERAGLEYRPYAEEEVCCGFGGSFSVDFPMLSARILGQKLDNIEATGADAVVTDCPGCVLQLRGGLDQRGSAIKACHIIEALAGRLPE